MERGAKKAERNGGNKCKIVEGFRVKKILFAASEGVPFIKTGGLADVVGSLPKSIDRQYYDVRVILPKYGCMKQEMKDKMQYVTNFYMDYNWKNVYVGVLEADYNERRAIMDADPIMVSVAGRMMFKRVMGKASFCNIQDLKGTIQVYVAKDAIGEESYADFKKSDIGDIYGIKGYVFRT